MDLDKFFMDLDGNIGLWCGGDTQGADLARMVEFISERNIQLLSVRPDVINVVWPWLEKSHVKIMGRFYLPDEKVSTDIMSDLTVRINSSFKCGANGALVFVPYKRLADMVNMVSVIRDDLFFNRDLIIGLDIGEIGSSELGDMFECLKKINASSVCFALTHDDGKKSDFVGRVYGLLNAWDSDFHGALHFALENRPERIEQAYRLVKSIRPELIPDLRVWINY